MSGRCGIPSAPKHLTAAHSVRSARERCLQAIALVLAATGLLPVIGLLLIVSGEWDLLKEISEKWGLESRALRLSLETGGIAVLTALVSAAYAVLFAHWSAKGGIARQLLGAAHLAVFFVSPFVYTQGWINLLGTGGFLENALRGSGTRLPVLYSAGGWVFLSVLQFIPLGLLVVWLARRKVNGIYQEDVIGYQFNVWNRIRTIHWSSYRIAFTAAFFVVFLFTFWNWEIPSMLRQNSFPLEVMSFFGSFYDYGSAIALALPSFLITGVIAIALAILEGRRGADEARCGSRPTATPSGRDVKRNKAGWFVFSVFPILSLLMPVLALAAKIDGWEEVKRVLALFRHDIPTTLTLGVTVGLIASTIAVLVQSQMAVRLKPSVGVTTLSWVAITLPGILSGIGLAKLFSEVPLVAAVSGSVVRLFLCELILFVPLAIVGMNALSSFWKRNWTEHAKMTGNPWLFFQVGLSAGWLQILGLVLAIASLVMREVPVALANYPPGASTVALTIETVLHFDQPAVVSVLCLTQLALVFILWLIGGGIAFLVKHVQQRERSCREN